jgi:hypothetical protein
MNSIRIKEKDIVCPASGKIFAGPGAHSSGTDQGYFGFHQFFHSPFSGNGSKVGQKLWYLKIIGFTVSRDGSAGHRLKLLRA